VRHAARRTVNALVIGVLFVVSAGTAAAAAPKIVKPSESPFIVQAAAGGKLQPFTIRASGFQPGQQVYVEQCDGIAITDPHWTPAVDCDIGTSPAPVFAPASGVVEFAKVDLNHRFTPIMGLSPQGGFACFTTTAPKGIPHFDTCKLRISTNNTQPTKDQLFLELVLPGHAVAQASSSSSGTSPIVFVAIGVLVAAVVAVATVIGLRARRASTP
jgi:hypothetical protein